MTPHHVEVFVRSVIRPQPVALAGVARQHGGLFLQHGGDVQEGRWRNGISQWVDALDRIAVVQIRHPRTFSGRPGQNVRHGINETGRAGQQRGHLVIDHVVARSTSQNQRWGNSAKQLDALPQRRLIVDHQSVPFAQTMVRGVDHLRGLACLLGAAMGNRPAVLAHAAAIPRGGGCHVYLPARFRQADERAAAENLGVIGVRHEAQGNAAIRGWCHRHFR